MQEHLWELSAPDDTDPTAIKVAIDDVILPCWKLYNRSKLQGRNLGRRTESPLVHHWIGSQNIEFPRATGVWKMLAHFADENWDFIMRRLDIIHCMQFPFC